MGSACRSGLAIAALLLGAACGRGSAGADRWHPSAAASWQWQLQGSVNTGYDVDIYDIDLIRTSPDVFETLRSDGRRVVCYFSAGTWETFRGDRAPPEEAMGKPLVDFPDERWLDIRHASVRTRVVGQLDLARERSCDGVEPDNVDGFANDTGFDLSAADQLAFNRFLAAEAHERDLAVGLKNDLDQVAELARDFDFAVNEQCHEFAECEALVPFVDARKPVFNAEYHDTFRRDPTPMCDASQRLGLQTLVLPTELDDSFRISCADRQQQAARSWLPSYRFDLRP